MASIRFPNTDTIFAFNRYQVKISGASAGDEFEMKVARYSGGQPVGDTYTETRKADADGNANFVFNHYVQLFFDKETLEDGTSSLNGIIVGIAEGGEAEEVEQEYTAYWGGISAGERMADRTIRYYPALNNPLPLWKIGGASAFLQKDNDEQVELENESEEKTHLIDLRDYFDLVGGVDGARELILTQLLVGREQSIFDDTFDYTFIYFTKNNMLKTTILFDCSTDGVYLKWIDAQGVWYYYMFEPFTKTMKTKEVGDDYETFFESTNIGYYGALRPRGYTQENTQTLVASLVSKEERNMLNTILASPLVYLCADLDKLISGESGAEWIPVRVVAGSTKDDLSNYADFEITIQYPDSNVQLL